MGGEINIKKSANASAIMTTMAFVLVAILLIMFIFSQSDVQYVVANKLYEASQGVQNRAEDFRNRANAQKAIADHYEHTQKKPSNQPRDSSGQSSNSSWQPFNSSWQQLTEPLLPNDMTGGSKASKWTGIAFGITALVLMFVSGALEYRLGYAADPNAMA